MALDIVGVERSPAALSLSYGVSGLAIAIALPIAGLFADLSGSYEMTFAFLGIVQIISGILLFFVPFLLKKQLYEPLSQVSK